MEIESGIGEKLLVRATSPYLLLSPYPLFLNILGAITMSTKSHTMIIEKLGHRLSILIAALYSLITHHCLLITALIIPLFQVFLSQNSGVPDQKRRRSKSISKPFQMLFQVCSKCAFLFGQDFSKSLRKLHQNYTKITPT